ASIEVYNYTARPRAYTLLSTWPEREGVMMVDNPLGGRREARGLWAWKLETLDPGASTTVSFTVGGLAKGDWSDIDIFFRGAGDIIGATKIDEAILAEMLREEDAGVEREVIVEIESIEPNQIDAPEGTPPDVIVNEESNQSNEPEQGWFGVGRGEEE
nr:hypothetical protein [Candidatus Poseidoniales archaeon]